MNNLIILHYQTEEEIKYKENGKKAISYSVNPIYINPNNIIYFSKEADDKFTTLHLIDGTEIKVRETPAEIMPHFSGYVVYTD